MNQNEKLKNCRVLGVCPDANPQEIKAAYYRLAKKWHPDKNSDPNARTKFEEIHYAYKQLSKENSLGSENNYSRELQGNRNPDTKSFFDKFSEEGKRDFCERLGKNENDTKPRENEWQEFNEIYPENNEYKEDNPWNSISDEEKIEILKIRISRLKSNLSEPGYLNEKQREENLEQIDEFEEEIRSLKERIIIRLKFEIQQLRKEKEILQDPSKVSEIEEDIAKKEKQLKELEDSLESYYKSLDSEQLDDEIKRTKSELEKAKDDKGASSSERKKRLEKKLEKLEAERKVNGELKNNKFPVKIIIGGGILVLLLVAKILVFRRVKKIFSVWIWLVNK